MGNKKYGNEYRLTLLCVDSYEDSVLKGRYYNPSRKGGVQFRSAVELLLSAEEMLEEMQLPQAFSRSRTFADSSPGSLEMPASDWAQTGKLATFQIRVLFRQNASWQGIVRWLDGKKEESFRSVLELIILIDSALKENLRKQDI